MKFHLLGLAHLPTSKYYSSCAFTTKNVKLPKMLLSLGHEVVVYGALSEIGSSPECSEFVETHTVQDIARDYGDGDNRFEVGYNWTNADFRHDFNGPKKLSTLALIKNSVEHINVVKQPDDFLLCTQGYYHKDIIDAVKMFLICEPGVGYRGALPNTYKAFESNYIQNYTYGSNTPHACSNGSFYDRVIPNYFDPGDIEYSEEKEDYYLFMGRMIYRKGILIAAQVCNAIDKKLIIAGQGGEVINGHLIPTVNPDFNLPPGTWEYVGYQNIEQRKKLMAHAKAVFCPTIYLECFGGVHVEAMLSGTPVITTNFGVYPGTYPEGICGFHCDTLDDFHYATEHVRDLSPKVIRAWSERYLMDNVKWQYERWFQDLYDVWESTDGVRKGWSRVRTVEPEWRSKLLGIDKSYLDALAQWRA